MTELAFIKRDITHRIDHAPQLSAFDRRSANSQVLQHGWLDTDGVVIT